ncbi:thiopurine S-methyltransferase [Agarivorans sp. B2Z047]|uniref:thiopurine S-methyltransferase n=1 Tax=Agarivorans sp. B2Z047 TaxID=2652721 RepID=UPI001406CA60|nr:thiopurine S-methyltransferase [Agarivorans sp. B2Z047]MPW29369.1 thiopurine S-methyltransferase [Agarivorans sp. B2Z047]UQN44957.1 thiopurine S-methyltransferase [Agarivorans sp. B2Z047]
MHEQFWHQKWEKDEIGFHEGEVNRFLYEYFNVLKLAAGARVFVPLCGKTRDIAWLLDNGMRVVGVELSEHAIKQLFAELNLEPKVESLADGLHYTSANIDIFVANIFSLNSELLGEVDAIYDRGALVALPEGIRTRYAQMLPIITNNAPQLVVTYNYEQSQYSGPPFALPEPEIERLYASIYALKKLASRQETEGFAKGIDVENAVWLLGS